ncbi:MAG: LysR family transcriptional regulator [Phycisphaerae bacterium]|nr:MAG: LysR family transcriptional regulator [Phycisphaerae bacterium]
MKPSEKLTEMNLSLPNVAQPVGMYVPATIVGNLAYTSGQIPIKAGDVLFQGKVGDTVSLEDAQNAAQVCALNALAAIASISGGIDKISRIIRLCVFVASTPDFTDQPKVANAASELCGALFGEAGKHVRSAVGVASLPLNVSVELEMIAELA